MARRVTSKVSTAYIDATAPDARMRAAIVHGARQDDDLLAGLALRLAEGFELRDHSPP